MTIGEIGKPVYRRERDHNFAVKSSERGNFGQLILIATIAIVSIIASAFPGKPSEILLAPFMFTSVASLSLSKRFLNDRHFQNRVALANYSPILLRVIWEFILSSKPPSSGYDNFLAIFSILYFVILGTSIAFACILVRRKLNI